MRRWAWTLLLIGCAPDATPEDVDPSEAPIEAYDPIPLVDPFVATGGDGARSPTSTPARAGRSA